MEQKKPLILRVPRKNKNATPSGVQTEVAKTVTDKPVPLVEETAYINKGVVPNNLKRLDENDEKAYIKNMPLDGEMYLYTHSGQSVGMRNFYRGASVFMMLSGPSLAAYDLSLLKQRRGIITMGVNNSWAIFKPNLWISVDDPGNFVDIGWKDPSITKFVPMGHSHKQLVVKEPDGKFRASQFRVNEMPSVYYFKRNHMFRPKQFLYENTVNWGCGDDETDELGCKGGRSVMLAGLKMLYYLGFRTVYLLGADFKMVQGEKNYAFAQARSDSSVKGNNSTYEKLNKRFVSLLPDFAEVGFRVYNCYKESGLTAFPHISYEKAIEASCAKFDKTIDTEGWYDRKDREKKAKQEHK